MSTTGQVPVADVQGPPHGLAQGPLDLPQGLEGMPIPPDAGYQAPVQGLTQGPAGVFHPPVAGVRPPAQEPADVPVSPALVFPDNFQGFALVEPVEQAKKDELDALKAEVARAIADMKLHLPTGQQTIVDNGAEETLANVVARCQDHMNAYTMKAVFRRMRTVRSNGAALRGASTKEVREYYRDTLSTFFTFMDCHVTACRNAVKRYRSLEATHLETVEKMHKQLQLAYNAQIKLADIEVENDMIKAGYVSLETEYADLKIEKDVLQADYLKLREECHKLGVEKDELETKKEQLVVANRQLETDYANIKAEKDNREAQHFELQVEFSKLREQYDNLHGEGSQLYEEKSKLEAEFSQIQEQYNQLSVEKNELMTKNHKLEAEKDELQTKNGQLEVEKDQLKADSEQHLMMYMGAANL